MLPTTRSVLVPMILATLAAGCATPGPERARYARDGLDDAHERLATARVAADSARDSLEALVSAPQGDLGPGADLAPMFEAYEDSVKRLRRQAELVSRLPERLRARGDAYFDQWERDLLRIQDPALRAASASRRGEALATYNRVVGTIWSAQSVFQPLLALQGDLRLAIGNDLTEAGLATVREATQRVALETETVGERLEALMTEVQTVSEAMSSAPSAQDASTASSATSATPGSSAPSAQ
jgi:hypothetical protein